MLGIHRAIAELANNQSKAAQDNSHQDRPAKVLNGCEKSENAFEQGNMSRRVTRSRRRDIR